eukprot:13195-Prymnesium_polylepis.1
MMLKAQVTPGASLMTLQSVTPIKKTGHTHRAMPQATADRPWRTPNHAIDLGGEGKVDRDCGNPLWVRGL